MFKMVQESTQFDFYKASEESEEFLLPYLSSLIECGFPSPATDHLDSQIDLNKLLIRNPYATFYARVKGTSLLDANVNPGDLVIIDKSLIPKKNSICMCILDGDFTLKYVQTRGNITYLVPCNPHHKEIKIEAGRDFEIWGVVLHIIHSVY